MAASTSLRRVLRAFRRLTASPNHRDTAHIPSFGARHARPQHPAQTPIHAPGHGQPLQPAIIVYALFGGGIIFPLAAIAGVIYAYVERGKDPVLDSHLNFQIATFWWGLLMIVVGFVLAFFLVGILIWLFWFVWLVVRMITGFQLAQANRAVSGVEMMGFKAV